MAVYVRLLEPADAARVARLESRTYGRAHRAGRRHIAKLLSRAAGDRSNLSIGVFEGRHLLGCVLAYRSDDRRQLFDAFEVALPETHGIGGPSVYIEDFIIEPGAGRHMIALGERWAEYLYRRARGLPLDAFCLPELVARWRKHAPIFRRMGFEQAEAVAVDDLSGDMNWHWVSWAVARQGWRDRRDFADRRGSLLAGVELPGRSELRIVRTERQWLALREDWNALHQCTEDADAFSTFDVLYQWWRQFGLEHRLLIVVLYRAGRVAAIGPLMVSVSRQLLRFLRQLSFIGDQMLTERPKFLRAGADREAEQALWRGIHALRSEWDTGLFCEQALERPGADVLELFAGSGLQVVRAPFSKAPYIERNAGGWHTYLASRSRSVRKRVKRKIKRLAAAGNVAVAVREGDDCIAALDAYTDVERRSWKAAVADGLCNQPDNLDYYRRLFSAQGEAVRFRFTFLSVDGREIAATFGVFCRNRYSSIEICHDKSWSQYSPGVVLTAYELERWMDGGASEEFDFLLGSLENKNEWATAIRITRDLFVFPAGWHGSAQRRWLFEIKPRLKAMLKRIGVFDMLYRRLKPPLPAPGQEGR